MKRVIKFRAWEKTEGRMLDLSAIPHDAFNVVLFHDLILKGKKSLTTGGKTYEYEVMQFTGLLDKNGKEVFEGDVLSTGKGHPVVVEWQNRTWSFPGFGVFDKNRDSELNFYHFAHYGEVIGNRFENPDLLSV